MYVREKHGVSSRFGKVTETESLFLGRLHSLRKEKTRSEYAKRDRFKEILTLRICMRAVDPMFRSQGGLK
jgi:hypothetical protein